MCVQKRCRTANYSQDCSQRLCLSASLLPCLSAVSQRADCAYGRGLTHCAATADNLINGRWACENNQTQNVELKGYAGYKYAIRSDYGATHSTVAAALSGLDQEFPGGPTGMFAAKLKAAVLGGNVSQAVLDDKGLQSAALHVCDRAVREQLCGCEKPRAAECERYLGGPQRGG